MKLQTDPERPPPVGAEMATAVDITRLCTYDVPQRLVASGTDPSVGRLRRTYAVGRNGDRFLVNVPESAAPSRVTVVVDWLSAVTN